MRIDLILESNNSPDRIAELGQLAEANGIGGIWVSGMLDGRDPFALFTKLALTTNRIRMGPIAISPFELHPLMMAKSLLTLNEYSNGRAQVVVGGGGGTMTAMNIQPVRRVRAVRECLEILKAAATGQPINYEGEVFQVRRYSAPWATSAPPAIYGGANRAQMQHMVPAWADGLMLSDKLVPQVAEARAKIDAVLDEKGRDKAAFRVSNFWAWHVKETRAEAEREARIWLALRGVLLRANHAYFMNEADMDIVDAKRGAFFDALRRRSPDIHGVPEPVIRQLVDNLTSCASVAEVGQEIDRLRAFQAAGLTEIALRIYEEPEKTIRLLGEKVVPALA
ncbi:MAG: LLM class flavin-dependent oxidoreductase [Gammaproteobacteria bacterium]|nr:LLM class flavin-dependent oxidoreductase [Gammaproteobacteria bacterium]